MKNDFISYSKQTVDDDDIKSVVNVLRSPFLTQGDRVPRFEKDLSRITKSKYVVAVNSGTAALHAACYACGIKSGDEVITTPLTFAASANCIIYLGATPIFADCDNYGLLDPEKVIKKISRKTKALLTVDYGGCPSHLKELRQIANRYNLILIEDAAHSLGATFKGKPVGSIADLTCFSFHPVKLITTSEGGAVATNKPQFYKKLLLFRNHGITKNRNEFISPYEGPWQQEMHILGYNLRMTDIQAALGISQLKKMKKFLGLRTAIARSYTRNLQKLQENELIDLPKVTSNTTSAWHLYPLRINFNKTKYSKKQLFQKFLENGVRLQVHYPPIHLHPYYNKKYNLKKGDFPNAERFYNQEISLPVFPALTKTQRNKVISLVEKFIIEN